MTMSFDWTTGPLAQGLHCYRSGEFFEAHEHWEAVWLESDEPQKTFLQALIQVTAAFHHLSRNNTLGAASLLRRALRRLDGYPAEYAGIAVEQLRVSLRSWLKALEKNTATDALHYPAIH
jgi:predicted metal-dependent hydrolase